MPVAFQTTHWSVVLASRGDSVASRHALEQLCETYWQPLYAFVRRLGYDADSSRDLVQGYFLRLLDRDYLGDVRPEKGRFRAFLMASIRHYLSDERKAERARKRSPERPMVSLDAGEAESAYQAADSGISAEELFDQRWAHVVLDRAVSRLREDERAAGRSMLCAQLEGHLFSGTGQPLAQIGERLEMSEGAVKVALHRLRRRFGQILRREVAQTVVSDRDVDLELRHLLDCVSGSGGLEAAQSSGPPTG